MDFKELMSTTPEELEKLQFIELKKYVLNKLDKVREHINNDEYDKLEELCCFVPAGYSPRGVLRPSHYFINFDYQGRDEEDGIDIEQVVSMLVSLRPKKRKS